MSERISQQETTNPVARPWAYAIGAGTDRADMWLISDDQDDGPNVIGGPPMNPGDSVPRQIVESVVNLETGGTWNPNTVHPSSGATGFGQILPDGSWELGKYEELTGEDISQQELFDPETNLEITSFGLGARWLVSGKKSWFDAGMNYFGCTTASSQGDGNFSCRQYRDTLKEYVREWYGTETVEHLDAGKSDEPEQCGTFDFACQINKMITGEVGDLKQYLPIVGAVAVGGVLIVLAFVTLRM